MKKKLVVPILILLIAVALLGAYKLGLRNGKYSDWLSESKPPLPKVMIDGKDIQVFGGSYSWCEKPLLSGLITCVNSDSPSPVDYIKSNNYKAETVISGSVIEAKAPKGIREFNLKTTAKDFVGDSYIIPKEKGTYIYYLHAVWRADQGNADFFFAVEIK
ncbi:hypothetical protein [Paenibacillus sp. N3.4]|uniref:hypothetical protein n=1 Tax=Paenibacillus sp. N3.4 TaxID=2603222 RepID=UPI0011C87947|nr:hypothetical protein [Paenibacillus sp. N3.4]TXK85751.1 hypothetical protein FU659_02260 [Paenibacillus sp. N3.4]